MRRTFLHSTIALALAVSVSWCQSNLGGLTGRIADSTGAGIPTVALKITNIYTAAEVRISSSSDGAYLSGNLPPGRYRVAVRQEVLIDGVDMQNIGAPGFIAEASPPYESVEEFKVQNTMYPAEYGGGYGVMNFTLKSGTNQYHGDLFEFLRNDKFDARGFFARSKSMLRQNEFGGTFGGPLVLPKLYNGKDRTFFFASYSGFRLRGGIAAGNLQTLPTTQQRSGDFSDYPFPLYDPSSTRPDGAGGFIRDPFSNNRIPGSPVTRVSHRT